MKPKLVLFDYGQTLCNEMRFDALRGERAVLEQATENPAGVTAEEVQALFKAVDEELNRRNPDPWGELVEISNLAVQRYVYESLGLRFTRPPQEVEQIFWDAATEPTNPTEQVRQLLDTLWRAGVRTGVVSNLTFTSLALQARLDRCLPGHHFEFALASSDYVFRKPHPRFYQLALQRAGVLAAEAWFCGDNAVCDVDGPSAMGMRAFWYTGAMRNPYTRDIRPTGPHTRIDHWSELEEILALESRRQE